MSQKVRLISTLFFCITLLLVFALFYQPASAETLSAASPRGQDKCPKDGKLVAYAPYGCISHDRKPVVEAQHLLESCSNITSLTLHMHQCGCVISFDDHYTFDFGTRPFSTPPKFSSSLEKLSLYGYDFDAPPRPDSYRYGEPWTWKGFFWSMSQLWEWLRRNVHRVPKFISGEQSWEDFDWLNPMFSRQRPKGGENTNLEAWIEAMDWSRIKHLDIDYASPQALEVMAENLPNLESLSLGPWYRWAFNETTQPEELESVMLFLDKVGPLRGLSLTSVGSKVPLKRILERHCPTLKELKIHERDYLHAMDEQYGIDRPREALEEEELKLIRDECPDLESLTVDVNRDGEWPMDIMSLFTTFDRLSNLTLNFQLATANETYLEPRLNHSSALELFHFLRSEKKGQPLEVLKLELGNVGEIAGGGLRFPGFEEERRGSYECRLKQDCEEECEVCEGIPEGWHFGDQDGVHQKDLYDDQLERELRLDV